MAYSTACRRVRGRGGGPGGRTSPCGRGDGDPRVDRGQADCSNSGPGTTATPLCTISAGAARAGAGDTVLVCSGIYTEQVTLPRSGRLAGRSLLRAANGASVTVRGRTNGFRIDSRSWITIRGFKVADTTGHGIYLTASSRITIQNNEVLGAGARTGATARGISLGTTTASVVRGNNTHDNSDAGIFLGAGATDNVIAENRSSENARGYIRAAVGIDIRAASNNITRNVTFDNEDSGINIWDGAHGSYIANNVSYRNGDHGIDNKGSSNTRILSNTVYRGVDSGIDVANSTGVTLANNISANNGLNSPRTEGNIRVDSISAPSLVAGLRPRLPVGAGRHDRLRRRKYSSLAGFKAATGRERRGVAGEPEVRVAQHRQPPARGRVPRHRLSQRRRDWSPADRRGPAGQGR